MPGLFVIPQLTACLSEAGHSFPLTTLWPSETSQVPEPGVRPQPLSGAGGPPHRINPFSPHRPSLSLGKGLLAATQEAAEAKPVGREVSAVCYPPPEPRRPPDHQRPTLASGRWSGLTSRGTGSKGGGGTGRCGRDRPALRVRRPRTSGPSSPGQSSSSSQKAAELPVCGVLGK